LPAVGENGIIVWRRRDLNSRIRKILIVDDESSMRFLLRVIFERAGYEVLEAHHGAAALERVKESRPNLVVTDLMMPVMNGRDLVGRLRADPETASIPILLITANPHAAVAAVDAIVGKPFDPEAVVETARSLAGSGG
jgi:CheY-like chemotaxis protein